MFRLCRRWVALAAVLVLAVGCRPVGGLLPFRRSATGPADGPPAKYGVVVFGATPEGVAAAVAAARAGERVALVDAGGRLGGLLVTGWLNSLDLNRGPQGDLLNGGLFVEWYRQVEGDSFDPHTAEQAFWSLVTSQPGIETWLETTVRQPLVGADQLLGVVAERHGSTVVLTGDRYIDATADADIAAAAGVAFTAGAEDARGERRNMAATLVFRLTGVNWPEATAFLWKGPARDGGATAHSLWGYGEIMARYRPSSPRLGVRGLNVGRMNDGSVLVNALWLFDVNPFQPASRESARAAALAELPRLVAYIRQHCPGFAAAALAGTAPELYVRESRHLFRPLYLLTLDDVLDNRDQPDAIGYGSYPVDLQARAPGEAVQIAGVPRRYALPLRSLIPAGWSNLLIASRSAGYSELASGSARTVPVGMAAAQGAAMAAVVARRHGVSLPYLAAQPALVAEVQQRLREQGVQLAPFSEPSPLDGVAHAEDVRWFRRHGLVMAGYGNNYRLTEAVTARDLRTLLEATGKRLRRPLPLPGRNDDPPLTVQTAANLLHQAAGTRPVPVANPAAKLTRAMLYHLMRTICFPNVP